MLTGRSRQKLYDGRTRESSPRRRLVELRYPIKLEQSAVGIARRLLFCTYCCLFQWQKPALSKLIPERSHSLAEGPCTNALGTAVSVRCAVSRYRRRCTPPLIAPSDQYPLLGKSFCFAQYMYREMLRVGLYEHLN